MPAEETLLGLDIGATKLAVRAIAPDREWTARVEWAGDGWGDDLALLSDILAEARAAVGTVDRVGVAAAPTVDAAGRVTAWPSRPAWVGAPLVDTVAAATGAQVRIADDGSLAALAEADAAGCPDLVYLGIGTGLGGGLVVGGRLVLGATGTAGELGHLPLSPNGLPCGCGRRGCLQTVVSGPALAARATQLRGRPTSTEELASAVHNGHPWALQVVDEAADALAWAVVLLSELVEPARVHIGGGLGAALPELPDRITAALRPRPGHPLPVIAPALLGPDASLAGALLLAGQMP